MKLFKRITLIAAMLAFIVVMLGAYTRLTHAGLGCPDWPGCYGSMVVPKAVAGETVEVTKAWTEMVHRYIAGSLGLFILFIGGFALSKRKQLELSPLFPVFLVGLLFFQAALGMWTVTLKLLPVVVMGHLLGGITLLATLWYCFLSTDKTAHSLPRNNKIVLWSKLALVVLCLQIALGGWVSSNYAALICPDFPFCQGHLLPHLDLKSGFNLFSPIGNNYQGGVLGNSARVSIHMMHRFGALLATFMIASLAFVIITKLKEPRFKRLGHTIAGLLGVQVTLGILNVKLLLPLPIAVAHNGVAALLLLSLITFIYRYTRTEGST